MHEKVAQENPGGGKPNLYNRLTRWRGIQEETANWSIRIPSEAHMAPAPTDSTRLIWDALAGSAVLSSREIINRAIRSGHPANKRKQLVTAILRMYESGLLYAYHTGSQPRYRLAVEPRSWKCDFVLLDIVRNRPR